MAAGGVESVRTLRLDLKRPRRGFSLTSSFFLGGMAARNPEARQLQENEGDAAGEGGARPAAAGSRARWRGDQWEWKLKMRLDSADRVYWALGCRLCKRAKNGLDKLHLAPSQPLCTCTRIPAIPISQLDSPLSRSLGFFASADQHSNGPGSRSPGFEGPGQRTPATSRNRACGRIRRPAAHPVSPLDTHSPPPLAPAFATLFITI
jgi:hypothetical protein